MRCGDVLLQAEEDQRKNETLSEAKLRYPLSRRLSTDLFFSIRA
jgi:hypothetical protein